MDEETLNRLVEEQEELEEQEWKERSRIKERAKKILYLIERGVITKKPVIRTFLFWTTVRRCPECGQSIKEQTYETTRTTVTYYSCSCGYEYAKEKREDSWLSF